MKVLISAILIVTISEVAKRSSFLGAILASVPIVSVLAMIWLYLDTHNAEPVALLAKNIFWLVLPSLIFFLTFPVFIQHKINFYLSLTLSLFIMILSYGMMIFILKKFGIT